MRPAVRPCHLGIRAHTTGELPCPCVCRPTAEQVDAHREAEDGAWGSGRRQALKQ